MTNLELLTTMLRVAEKENKERIYLTPDRVRSIIGEIRQLQLRPEPPRILDPPDYAPVDTVPIPEDS